MATPATPVSNQDSVNVASVAAGWPISVIKTLTDIKPPRAILTFPSGEERVVKAGQLISEHNIVVMSIGVRGVELVKVKGEGGRATLLSLSLPSQY